MDPHDAVVDLPTTAVPLAAGADGLFAALGGAGLVHATDGFRMSMVLGDDLLAAISELLFIPLNRFEKALQRAGRGLELQRNGLGGFAVQIRQLTFDIDPQQFPGVASPKTIGEPRQKQRQLPPQGRNLLECHL